MTRTVLLLAACLLLVPMAIAQNPSVQVHAAGSLRDPAGDYAFEMFERVETQGAAPAGAHVARLEG